MHVVDADRPARRSEQLLEERLAVAHAARGPAGDEAEGGRIDAGPFRLDDLGEPTRDRRGVDRLKVEPLAAGEDRDREFLRLGRAEHELHVRRRLFERLEEGVEGLPREHVHFVDDVDLEAAPRRPHGDVLPQLPDLVDAAVARSVDLHHVDILPGGNRPARLAGVAGFGRRSPFALEGLGVDPRGARLPNAAGAGEEIGVADPPRLDRAGESAGHVLLADQFIEPLRPVAAGDDLIGSRFSHDFFRVGRTAAGRR